MSLDFGDKHKGRKFQCFVCGCQFPEYNEYRDHIIEKHEEGREYIRCPLNTCLAPVRDVRAHFAAKHPKHQVPKVGLMRATVWKDFGAKGEKKKSRKPTFREGYYESSKMQRKLHYRSGYEAKIYEYLDADVDVNAFDVEPFEIPYIHKGEAHKYIPDIIVKFIDGRTEIWEVKPANQTMLERNQDKWEAAGRACKGKGWEFIVMTEQGIEKLRLKVKSQQSRFGDMFTD
jgi:hypothetical protein